LTTNSTSSPIFNPISSNDYVVITEAMWEVLVTSNLTSDIMSPFFTEVTFAVILFLAP
jgi:hypothetical protein